VQPHSHEQLEHLSTSWALLQEAHDPRAHAQRRADARGQLIRRYEDVVRRYLGGALRHEDDRQEAIDECFQRFSLRVLEGALHSADASRGRFHNYLRTCLSNLVTDYRRERARQPAGLPASDPAQPDADPVSDAEFRELYREGLVIRALQGLARHEQQTGQLLFTVLKVKMDHPDLHAPQIAERLSAQLARPLSAVWVRQRLFQARRRLCELLRQEVRFDLQAPSDEQVDEEMADLGLLQYCRPTPSGEQPVS
jgi:RNA polymerase sigma factor (sigma-70 family)